MSLVAQSQPRINSIVGVLVEIMLASDLGVLLSIG